MSEDLPGQNKEHYIGDGLYVSFDGWGIRLRTRRDEGDHWVGLDPDVWSALGYWIDRYPALKKHMESHP